MIAKDLYSDTRLLFRQAPSIPSQSVTLPIAGSLTSPTKISSVQAPFTCYAPPPGTLSRAKGSRISWISQMCPSTPSAAVRSVLIRKLSDTSLPLPPRTSVTSRGQGRACVVLVQKMLVEQLVERGRLEKGALIVYSLN